MFCPPLALSPLFTDTLDLQSINFLLLHILYHKHHWELTQR